MTMHDADTPPPEALAAVRDWLVASGREGHAAALDSAWERATGVGPVPPEDLDPEQTAILKLRLLARAATINVLLGSVRAIAIAAVVGFIWLIVRSLTRR
jgi:hypothetical protein